MMSNRLMNAAIAACLAVVCLASGARADELRHLKKGEPFPEFKLPTVDGALVDTEAVKGSVLVMVCVTAEQRSSEMAEMEAAAVLQAFAKDPVKLVYVTADAVHKAYFEKFREERSLKAPLGFDADRVLYAKLGLIVFPTTIVVNKEGRLSHVISLCGRDYRHTLEVYIRHALGTITDEQLAEQLKAQPAAESSPKSAASTHRALARALREKGQFDAAKAELAKALELEPKNAEVMLDLADLDLSSGKLADADTLVASALAVQPENRRAKQLKGISLFKQGKLAEAETVLLEPLALNPDPARVHYYLGRVYEQQGQTSKALEHYRESLKKFLGEADLPAGSTPK